MQIRADSISFERLQGSGPRTQTKDIAFDREVTQATVVLTGTDFGFSPSDDHHLGNINIKADLATIEGNIVRVTATLGVRDWSDNWDDDYEGTVHFAVIAETLAP